MASRKFVHLLAVAGIAALAPLTGSTSAIAATSAGNYELYNQYTDQCADVPGYGADASGSPVNQYDCNNDQSADNQQWGMLNTRVVGGNQLFVLVNVKSQLCMDLPGYGSVPNGADVSLYACNSNSADDNQEWYRQEIIPNAWLIVNYKNPDLCLDVAGWAHDDSDMAPNARLTAYTCDGPASDSNWDGYVAGYDDHLWAFQ